MQEHDDRLDTLGLQFRNEGVGRLGLVEEVPSLDASSSYERVRCFERHANEGNLDVVEPLDPIRWQRGFAVIIDYVCSEPLEVGSRIRFVREVATVDGVASTVLHAQQLVHTLIELVIADTRDIQVHCIQGFDRWLVVKQPGEGWRASDEVAGCDSEAELVALTQFCEFGGQVL